MPLTHVYEVVLHLDEVDEDGIHVDTLSMPASEKVDGGPLQRVRVASEQRALVLAAMTILHTHLIERETACILHHARVHDS